MCLGSVTTATVERAARAWALTRAVSLSRVSPPPVNAGAIFSLSPQRFGRHPVLILSVLFMLGFGLSVAFSADVTMFSTLRFFEGFCLAGLALSLYVLSKYLLPLPVCSPLPLPFSALSCFLVIS